MPRLLTSISCAALAVTKKKVLFSSKTRGVPHVRDHVQPRWPSQSRTNGESIFFCVDSFFHECGRRVGMVPRSLLKEGKKGRWWRTERRPQKTNPKPNTQARKHWVKRVKLRLVSTSGPEFAKEEDCSANCVHGKPPRRLQTDFPHQVLVTSGHTTVWQNKVTLQVRCLAMLQQWLQSGQPNVRRSKQQSLEKTILVAQPVQPVAHTRPVKCCQTEINYGGNP